MQQANLNRDGTYFIFHDGQVLANALNTASQQWCAMIHHLRYDRVFRNHPEVAKRYIRSSISYLVTFPMHSVVNTVFKYPTTHAVLASNFLNHAWKKIRVPNDQIVPIAQAQLILGLLKNIVDNPQPDRFLSERIGIDHPVFNQHIKPHISHRKILAAVMSLLPSSYIDKLGEAQWLCILEAVANDLVVPPGFPERFLREIAIGPRAHPEILRKLQQSAMEYARQPAKAPGVDYADVQIKHTQIMAESFGAKEQQPRANHRIYGKIYDRLGDIPPEILGDLGQPLYLKKGTPNDPSQPRQLAAYVFPRLNPEQPAPATWGDPEHTVVVVPVRKDLLAGSVFSLPARAPASAPAQEPAPVPAPAPAQDPAQEPAPAQDPPLMDFPSAALDNLDACNLPFFPEQGLLQDFGQEEDAPQEEEQDPFANFASQPEDYDAWLMQINAAEPDGGDRDDEQGPAKRARTAEAQA